MNAWLLKENCFLQFSRLAFHTGSSAVPVVFPKCPLDSCMYNVILSTSEEKMQGLEFAVYLGSQMERVFTHFAFIQGLRNL